MLNYQQLKEILPHAYPFLLIDRVEEYKEGESLTAIKNISSNEWPNQGNDSLIFPEVLLIEAAAQAALVLYHVSKVKDRPKPRYVLGRVHSEFTRPVEVGDQIQFAVSAGKMLDSGGYSNIDILRHKEKVSQVEIFYSAKANL